MIADCGDKGGLWQLRVGNIFASTVFCSYGGFWMSFGYFFAYLKPEVPEEELASAIGLLFSLQACARKSDNRGFL